MVIYTELIFVLLSMVSGAMLAEEDASALITFLLVIPIFGRVFGWW